MARSGRLGGRQVRPGPKPYPVIGNLLEPGGKPHKSLANLTKIHGRIMSLRLGLVTTVVVSSPSMAKAILKNYLRRKKINDLLGYVEENCPAGKAIGFGQAAFHTSLNLSSNTIFSNNLVDPN
ncbi:hypothetical protein CISIN_1g036837mg [Citrus sinensis]|uniref:Uncharacterized protein n=1 Tax=Citrus sinensis TaxID=2711 RepID=A0A067DMV7_CITSI|nr:hypothetical protein CISIN_1g036837mg [Citrus sinensis]